MGSSCSRTSTSAPEAKSKARRDSERRGLRQGLVHERKHANVYDFYEVVKEVGHGELEDGSLPSEFVGVRSRVCRVAFRDDRQSVPGCPPPDAGTLRTQMYVNG